MSILPYENIEIETALSLDEAVNVLHLHVETACAKPTPENNIVKPGFKGKISSEGFTITRRKGWFDGFRPDIRGVFAGSGDGLKVNIRVQFHWYIYLQLAFCALYVAWQLRVPLPIHYHNQVIDLRIIGVIIFVICTPIYLLYDFKRETNKAKQFFATILPARHT
ncbi:MAG: hypothetical protein QM802_07295 [Agriterribacter sp.]